MKGCNVPLPTEVSGSREDKAFGQVSLIEVCFEFLQCFNAVV